MKKRTFAALMLAVLLLSGCSSGKGAPVQDADAPAPSLGAPASSEDVTNSVEENAPADTENGNPQSGTEVNNGGTSVHGIASKTLPEDYNTDAVPFQTEIDAFNGYVEVLPVLDEDKDKYTDLSNEGYLINRLMVDGIPLYEVALDDGEEKPLIILLHGGGWHKENSEAEKWARMGFYAVSLDCAGSGESEDGPIQAPAAFAETVKDIDILIEYYNTVPEADATHFGIYGESMGGNIALCYVPHGKYKPVAICCQAATPDPILTEGPIWDCFDHGDNWQTSVWSGEQLENFVTAYKPVNFPESFLDVWVFAANGAEDTLAGPPDGNIALSEAVADLGGTKFVLKVYENYGHDAPSSELIPLFCEKMLEK